MGGRKEMLDYLGWPVDAPWGSLPGGQMARGGKSSRGMLTGVGTSHPPARQNLGPNRLKVSAAAPPKGMAEANVFAGHTKGVHDFAPNAALAHDRMGERLAAKSRTLETPKQRGERRAARQNELALAERERREKLLTVRGDDGKPGHWVQIGGHPVFIEDK